MRYVVLHHTGQLSVADHFDLMLSIDDSSPLLSWRCANWPPATNEAAEPIATHRRGYLDYQGPVSGGRGEVKRVEAGVLLPLQRDRGWRMVRPAGPSLDLVGRGIELWRIKPADADGR